MADCFCAGTAGRFALPGFTALDFAANLPSARLFWRLRSLRTARPMKASSDINTLEPQDKPWALMAAPRG